MNAIAMLNKAIIELNNCSEVVKFKLDIQVKQDYTIDSNTLNTDNAFIKVKLNQVNKEGSKMVLVTEIELDKNLTIDEAFINDAIDKLAIELIGDLIVYANRDNDEENALIELQNN